MSMGFSLGDEDKRLLLKVARDAIESRLSRKTMRLPQRIPPVLNEPCGAFVTLHKGGKLRGCIGHVAARKPLVETVREVAVAAALDDPRFAPLEQSELETMDLEISVLSPLRKTSDLSEIRVGVHGILIRRGYSSGLLLPQVATEHNWDRNTFLTNTCHKAGLSGDCWKSPDCEVEIFSAIVFSEKKLNR